MEERHAILPENALHSPLVPASAAAYTLAAIPGFFCLILLFDPGYHAVLMQDLVDSGIANPGSLTAWKRIGNLITLVACICPGFLAAGLFTYLRRPLRGARFLGQTAQWLLYGVTAGGTFCAAVFVIRAVRYILASITQRNAVMLLYSMIISEALMAALFTFAFFTLRRFLNCVVDAAAGFGYACASGKADSGSIPGFAATGFRILAVLGIILASDRIFTVTIEYGIIQSRYKLLIAAHPGQWLQTLSFLAGSVGNLLLGEYLHRCKRAMERAVFDARRRK